MDYVTQNALLALMWHVGAEDPEKHTGVDMTAEEPARVSKARGPALAEGREERCHRSNS